MDQNRQESQLEIARRYVALGKQRIARLRRLIEQTRAQGKPTDDLERLLGQHRDWLELARVYLEYEQDEAATASRSSTAREKPSKTTS